MVEVREMRSHCEPSGSCGAERVMDGSVLMSKAGMFRMQCLTEAGRGEVFWSVIGSLVFNGLQPMLQILDYKLCSPEGDGEVS